MNDYLIKILSDLTLYRRVTHHGVVGDLNFHVLMVVESELSTNDCVWQRHPPLKS